MNNLQMTNNDFKELVNNQEDCKVMKDIGNDDAEATREYLSHSILNPKQWEQNQLT
tara:strand:- start:380 stop:547 length:168 start_codon:yes stop_codon:yes gene_type:complete